MSHKFLLTGTAVTALSVAGGAAYADAIFPEAFDATLLPGESTTLRKTVVVHAGPPTSAQIDVHFLFDTTGTMGEAVAAVQAAT